MEAGDIVARLLAPESRTDPYPAYEQLRALGPVVDAGGGFFVATGYTAVDGLLRDPRLRVAPAPPPQSPGTPGPDDLVGVFATSILETDPPEHTRMRRLMAGAFTHRRVAAMREVIEEQATNLLVRLVKRGRPGDPPDFMTEFAYPLPVGVICTMLGVPAEDHAWFRSRAADLTEVLEFQSSEPALAAAGRAGTELRAYFGELITRRRAEPGDDLITALLRVHDTDSDRLSGGELLANLVLLLVAGFETTTNLLGNGLAVLLTHPEQADRLRVDPTLAPAYVSELLRIDSPVQLTTRFCAEPVELDGLVLPAGAMVLLILGAANRDPARFPDPDRFDPTRPKNQPLSFGAGAHYCLGAALARMEAEIAFPMLLREVPGLRLAGTPRRRHRLTLRGFDSLPVTVS